MYENIFKRFFDLFVAIIGIPFLIIQYIAFSILIKLEDKGPVFYNALRIGKNGVPFRMFKFRSMKVDAPDIRLSDGSTYNKKNDPRLTKIGKLIRESSLDETPQLLNVLFGQMSIVGPRPDLCTNNKISEEKKIVLSVKPGITGYSQAYFRNEIDKSGKLKNDLYYTNHISFFLDIKIIFRTIYIVLKREKMYKA